MDTMLQFNEKGDVLGGKFFVLDFLIQHLLEVRFKYVCARIYMSGANVNRRHGEYLAGIGDTGMLKMKELRYICVGKEGSH